VPPPQWAPPPLAAPPPSWPAPDVATLPESAPPPRGRRPAVVVVAALIVVGMAVAAIWVTPRLLAPTTDPTPAPVTSHQPGVVTVTPVPQPTAKTVLTSGGEVGRRVTFRTDAGTGSLTIAKATWSQAGLMAPPQGEQYLVIEVMITCQSGTVAINSLSLVAGTDPAVGAAFGPAVTDPLPGVTLTSGQKASGEVGFVIPADTTVIALLAANRHTAATIEVPGP
jgi:hypothetical protein